MNLFGTNVFLADTSHQNIDAIRYSKKQKTQTNKHTHTKNKTNSSKKSLKSPKTYHDVHANHSYHNGRLWSDVNIDSLCTEIFITWIDV